MAIYRQVHVSFWQDDFVLELTPKEKYFYLYLMTNSKTTQCGIYELPKKIIQFETGYNSETVDKLLGRFIDYGKILYSEDTREIFLMNWIKYNWSSSPRVIKCIEKEIKTVKDKSFLDAFQSLCIQYGYSMHTEQQEEEEEEEEEEEQKEEEEEEQKQKQKKHAYGEFKNTLLTDEELEKLKMKFPDWQERIESLSCYIDSKGKRYSSHYATILSWARRDKKDKPKSKFDAILNYGGEEGG